jgi:hypothetical protein
MVMVVAVVVVMIMVMVVAVVVMMMMMTMTTRAAAASTRILPFVVCCSNYNSCLNIMHSFADCCVSLSSSCTYLYAIFCVFFLTFFITARSCKMMIVTCLTNN